MIQSFRGYDYRFNWRLVDDIWSATVYHYNKRIRGEIFIHNTHSVHVNYGRVSIIAQCRTKDIRRARDLAADLFILLHQR